MRTCAIQVRQTGGPVVLQFTDLEVSDPGPSEILIRQSYAGVNFVDVYMRNGLYPVPLPFVPGVEGVGVAEAVGSDVSSVKPGDRVAYATTFPIGSYAGHRLLPEQRAVLLPDYISDETAAATMLKGCTVEYLVNRTYAVQKGDWILWHAASGGVGRLACQWLKSMEARVIGTAGSKEKAELALKSGCEFVIEYRTEDVAARVRQLTDGKGVAVVYDGVGKDTFESSLDSLRPRGLFVSFGNASGPVPPFAPLLLSQKGSLFFTRAGFKDYYGTRSEIEQGAQSLFEKIRTGAIVPGSPAVFALAEAAKAHEELEARNTTGSLLLKLP